MGGGWGVSAGVVWLDVWLIGDSVLCWSVINIFKWLITVNYVQLLQISTSAEKLF